MLSKRPKGATIHTQDKSGVASLLWMLFGAIVTVGVGVFLYRSGVFDLGANEPTEVRKPIQTKVDPNAPRGVDSGYAFYDVLPDQESKTIPDAVVPDKPTDASQPKRFKPDVVVEASKEELESAKPKSFQPVEGDSPISVEYEEATYDGDSTDDASDIDAPIDMAEIEGAETKETGEDNKQGLGALIAGLIADDSQDSSKQSAPLIETVEDASAKPTLSTQNDTKTLSLGVDGADNSATITNQSSLSTTQDAKKTSNTLGIDPDKPAIRRASPDDTPSTNNAQATPSKSYVLQINSYSTAERADKRRMQVMMAGVDAEVVKTLHNGQVVYKVISAPMTSKQVVIDTQNKLQNSGIDSLVIEQRIK